MACCCPSAARSRASRSPELGLLGTSWAAGFIAGCFAIPPSVQRVGHVRSYGALASVAAVTILLNLLIIHPWAWILLARRLRVLLRRRSDDRRELAQRTRDAPTTAARFSPIYQMVNFAASTVGQLALVLAPPTDFFYFVLGAIFYCLAILPTALSTAQTPRALKTARLDIKALYRNSPVGAVVVLSDRNGQRRVRNARPRLRAADRPAGQRHRDHDGRRAPRRLAGAVPARLGIGPHRPAPRSGRGRHRRRAGRLDHRRRRAANGVGRQHAADLLRRDDLSDVRPRRGARERLRRSG